MKNIIAAFLLLPLTPSLALAQNAAPDTAAAKALWEGNNTQCRNCHGKTGEGAFGPDLAGRGLSAAEFQQAVRKPWGIMPAFVDTQLSDADPAGQKIFHDVGCAQCHGPTFDMPRGTLGGLNADFELFKKLVYTHTAVMR